MKKKIVIILVILAIVALAAGAFFALKSRGSKKTVQTEIAEKRTIKSTVIAFGRVEPKSDVNISAQVSERIEKLYVEEGDTVEVGDMLVFLNQDRYTALVNQSQAQVRQVEANLKKATDNLNKVTELQKSGAVSEDALIAAQTEVEVLDAQLESSKAALREAQDNLSQTIIKSPLDGIVTSLQAERGEFVVVGTMNNAGSVIMVIAQLTDMQAQVDVDEADVADLVPGQYAKIELDALPDTFFDGAVVQVAHQAKVQAVGGEETRANFEVHIAIEDPSTKIRPGMSVTATITTAERESILAVPLSAVVAFRDTFEREKDEGEGEAVFVIEDGIAKKDKIKTGISDDRFIEIVEGVKDSQEIVTGPFKILRELKDGDQVKIEKSEGFGKWGKGGKKEGEKPGVRVRIGR